jgi:hypothetical protein
MRTEVTEDRLHAPVKQGFLPLAVSSNGASRQTGPCADILSTKWIKWFN